MLLSPDRRRSLRDLEAVSAFAAGTSAGAGASALVLWLLAGLASPLPAGVRASLLAVGALLLWGAREGPGAGRLPLPEARRQIPAEVFGTSLARGAWRFGLELGTGVRTYAPASAPYLLALVLLLADPTLGVALAAGLGFGLGRALPLVARLAGAGRTATAAAALGRPRPAEQTLLTLLVLAGGLRLA